VKRIYSTLFYAAAPLLLARLYWKGRRQPGYRDRIAERFGFHKGPEEPVDIWFHAVSVGECEAAFPVIKALLEQEPELRLLVTCTTPTGSARISAVLGDGVRQVYLPYDLPVAVDRFLDHFRPGLAVILETEIWPNLFLACRARHTPVVIINGRLSAKSARGYGRLRRITREALGAVRLIAGQTEEDAERYVAIGADPDRVKVMGNIKFDIEFDEAMRQSAHALRKSLFGSRPVWIAGSTHPGEEEAVLDALAEIREAMPEVLLVLVPRHPERSSQVRKLCEQRGQNVVNRSEGCPSGPDTQVFLVDGIGELRAFYAAADVAYIGGSLVTHGGQNPLEAAITGMPVLFGPHMTNFRDIAGRLLEKGAAVRIENAAALASEVLQCFRRPERAQEMGRNGRTFVESNRGAVERVLAMLIELRAEARNPHCPAPDA
jgi:3-deoxy-D-manno-octulosonic-acid transferase